MTENTTPPTITLFSNYGCTPCATLKPLLKALCDRLGIRINEVNITDRPDLAQDAKVMTVPVVIIGESTFYANMCRRKPLREALEAFVGMQTI